jgi:hypothetical protein
MNNFINNVIEAKTNYHFVLLKEHFFADLLLYKEKTYEDHFKDMLHEVLSSFRRTVKLVLKDLHIIKFTKMRLF